MSYDPFDFVKKYPIVGNDAPDQMKLFAAHALHQVTLFQIGDLGLQEAVDELRAKAVRHRLVAAYGRDEVEWIIGWAFAEIGIDYGDIRPLHGVYP